MPYHLMFEQSKVLDFYKAIDQIAKPQKVRGKHTRRRVCGVGNYYYNDLPQLTDELKETLNELIGRSDYQTAMIQIYEGGDSIGWHKDKKEKHYKSDIVEMWNWGFNRGSCCLHECGDEDIGYFQIKGHDKIPIKHGQQMKVGAYEFEHKAYTYKSGNKYGVKGCDFRMNITIRE
jgi:hypothetical protein